MNNGKFKMNNEKWEMKNPVLVWAGFVVVCRKRWFT